MSTRLMETLTYKSKKEYPKIKKNFFENVFIRV
jgi:hypothetical protein